MSLRTQYPAEYACWSAMKHRCLSPANPAYNDYGGRGIKVCKRWLKSFSNFLADMGRRTSIKLSLDRVKVNGDYKPSNCRWATRKMQAKNKRPRRSKSLAMGGTIKTRLQGIILHDWPQQALTRKETI